jgi:hypothetical protein
MLMVNPPGCLLLSPPLGGQVQRSDVLFPLTVVAWLIAGLPGLRRTVAAVCARGEAPA